jgi:glycerol transport system substrate-binding protein
MDVQDGSPKWRVAPSPHGAYWEPGMKLGYQDCGAWTLPASTPMDRRRAAWLYAQFCVCKTVSLKKTLVGLTPFRDSDLQSVGHDRGGAEPRRAGRVLPQPGPPAWTPTGLNVPDYALLAQLWWTRIGQAVTGRASPKRETLERGCGCPLPKPRTRRSLTRISWRASWSWRWNRRWNRG